MRTRSVHMICALVGLLAGSCSHEEPRLISDTSYSLQGVVQDSASLEPLAGAEVAHGNSAGGTFYAVAISDSLGRYQWTTWGSRPSGWFRFTAADHDARTAAGDLAHSEGSWQFSLDMYLPRAKVTQPSLSGFSGER